MKGDFSNLWQPCDHSSFALMVPTDTPWLPSPHQRCLTGQERRGAGAWTAGTGSRSPWPGYPPVQLWIALLRCYTTPLLCELTSDSFNVCSPKSKKHWPESRYFYPWISWGLRCGSSEERPGTEGCWGAGGSHGACWPTGPDQNNCQLKCACCHCTSAEWPLRGSNAVETSVKNKRKRMWAFVGLF